MEKLSYWLLFFLILHSMRTHSPISEKVWQPLLKSSMPFERDSALQNTPLSKQLFKTQPQIEHEDITSIPRYDMPATRTNKRRALWLQEVELDGWFIFLHIVVKTCTV